MKIDRFQHGSVLVLVPHGPVTEEEIEPLQDALDDAADSPRLVLSLRDVQYLDSKGLEALLDTSRRFDQQGKRLRLAEIEDCCREMLYLTDHLDSFEIHPTIDDAVRSLL